MLKNLRGDDLIWGRGVFVLLTLLCDQKGCEFVVWDDLGISWHEKTAK